MGMITMQLLSQLCLEQTRYDFFLLSLRLSLLDHFIIITHGSGILSLDLKANKLPLVHRHRPKPFVRQLNSNRPIWRQAEQRKVLLQ